MMILDYHPKQECRTMTSVRTYPIAVSVHPTREASAWPPARSPRGT